MFTLRLDHSSAPKPTLKPVTLVVRPCSGITGEHDACIPQYTSRTEVRYAGGRSRASLAIEHFGQTFLLLSKEQKDEVDLHYRTSCQWELDHDDGRVFSCVCLKTVECKSDAQGLQACSECLQILVLHSFQVSISRTGASDERRKYIPFRNQSVATGKMFATNRGLGRFVQETILRKHDMLLDFTVALSSGAFDDNPSFIQLLEVMTAHHQRQARGRGFQNMQYVSDFDQFCHELQCVRPEAYRLFSSKFGG
ncbi:hypothetical protein BDN71DRAFT_1382342 [Pleurotus eryngii]|uniref:Uncharacterized protein n=1 Tax=Pleurotus eryngii TaxID=5323 RepID=A0A9P6A512_PLEER|nr:hypothetical protein BDN71DRAFT_1382342 [Pleurotus eryngii]